MPTVNEHRVMDWSPDFGFIAVPNLNDSKISSGIIFDRNANFDLKEILVGHQAPLSCLKFSPIIYNYKKGTCFLLAVGDTSGCYSVWRISKSNKENS